MKPVHTFLVFFLAALFWGSAVFGQTSQDKEIINNAIDKINYKFAYSMYRHNVVSAPKGTYLKGIEFGTKQDYEAAKNITNIKSQALNIIFHNKQDSKNNTPLNYVDQINNIKNNYRIDGRAYPITTNAEKKAFLSALVRFIGEKINQYKKFLEPSDKNRINPYTINSSQKKQLVSALNDIAEKSIKPIDEAATSTETDAKQEVKAELKYKIGLSETNTFKEGTNFTFDEKKGKIYFFVKNISNNPITLVSQTLTDSTNFVIREYIGSKDRPELIAQKDNRNTRYGTIEYEYSKEKVDKAILTFIVEAEKGNQEVVTMTLHGYTHSANKEKKSYIKIDSRNLNKSEESLPLITREQDSTIWYWIGGIGLLFVLLLVSAFMLLGSKKREEEHPRGEDVITENIRPIAVNTLANQELTTSQRHNEEEMSYNADLLELKTVLGMLIKTKQSAKDKFSQANEECRKYNGKVQQNEDVKALIAKIKSNKEAEEKQEPKNEIAETEKETENSFFGGTDSEFNFIPNEKKEVSNQTKKETKAEPVIVYHDDSYISLRDITNDGGIKEGRKRPASNTIFVIKSFTKNGVEYGELFLHDDIRPTGFEVMFRSLDYLYGIAILDLNSTAHPKHCETLEKGKLIKRNDIWEVEQKMKGRFY